MYCENCGHKLNEADLFCEDCGTKVFRPTQNNEKNSNKTLWIILGCVFGGFFILFILIMVFIIGIINYTVTSDEIYDYEINDYIEEFDSVIESF